MPKIKMFCVSNIESELLEKLDFNLVGVGKKNFSKKYLNIKNKKNIQNKEETYSELTFHYWFWKNELNKYINNDNILCSFSLLLNKLKKYDLQGKHIHKK